MKATIGSISTGTLRTEDLMQAFAYELELYATDPGQVGLVADAFAWVKEGDEPGTDQTDGTNNYDNRGFDILSELQMALNDHAPDGCYFGAHEGHGADFGFWPCGD